MFNSIARCECFVRIFYFFKSAFKVLKNSKKILLVDNDDLYLRNYDVF
jgi:hypothetical protein